MVAAGRYLFENPVAAPISAAQQVETSRTSDKASDRLISFF